LKPGGTLTIAHGMSRDKINSHHKGTASKVSNGLMEVNELAEIFRKYLTVRTVISDDSMYQVAGIL
ncbi:MAG: class I SAM-dependent methyltransferase, partial [Lachnospiraceae bacterium]|nr:class I SAM-dependent methyltransferase [Lachnospiraceae bacterium]